MNIRVYGSIFKTATWRVLSTMEIDQIFKSCLGKTSQIGEIKMARPRRENARGRNAKNLYGHTIGVRKKERLRKRWVPDVE